MSISINQEKITVLDENGSKKFAAFFMVILSSLLIPLFFYIDGQLIAFISVALVFIPFSMWFLFQGYYKIRTEINGKTNTISIYKKRLGRNFRFEQKILFNEVENVSYMKQLNRPEGVDRRISFIYLEVNKNGKQRIKLISSPLHPVIGQKNDFGDVFNDAKVIAKFIGVPLEQLKGFQPLDS